MGRVTMRLGLTRQQAEDVLSALGTQCEEYGPCPELVPIMANIWRKLRKPNKKSKRVMRSVQRSLVKSKRKPLRKASR